MRVQLSRRRSSPGVGTPSGHDHALNAPRGASVSGITLQHSASSCSVTCFYVTSKDTSKEFVCTRSKGDDNALPVRGCNTRATFFLDNPPDVPSRPICSNDPVRGPLLQPVGGLETMFWSFSHSACTFLAHECRDKFWGSMQYLGKKPFRTAWPQRPLFLRKPDV